MNAGGLEFVRMNKILKMKDALKNNYNKSKIHKGMSLPRTIVISVEELQMGS
jgi:hypothetical protein